MPRPGETMKTMSSAKPTPAHSGPADSKAVQSGEVRSSAIMAAGTLVSRFLGFAKTWMLAAALGLGSTVNDTFINANNLPNLIFLLVAGGVFNAVLVPQIIKASKAPDKGADYISRLLTLAVLVLLALTLLVTLLAPWVIELTTQGYSPQQKALAVSFAFWCLPQIFFYGLYALLTQVLNAHGAFGPAMWAPILNNIVAIAGLGMFIWIFGANVANPHTLDNWDSTQTFLVAGFSTIGVVAQTAILLIPVFRLRLGLRPRFGWRGVGLGHAARLSVWTLATAAVGQLAFLYVMRIATIPGAERLRLEQAGDPAADTLPGNAVLEVASQLYLLPHSIIALSLATVLFNRMTRASQDGDRAALRNALSHGLRTMAVATVFGALALFALAGPLGMFFSGGDAPGRRHAGPDPHHPGPQHALHERQLHDVPGVLRQRGRPDAVLHPAGAGPRERGRRLHDPVPAVRSDHFRHRHPLHRRQYPVRDCQRGLPAPAPGPPGRPADRQLLHPDGLRRAGFRPGRCRGACGCWAATARTASPGAPPSPPW